MTNKEIYKVWAPNDVKWKGWVRPVPFIDINKENIVHEVVNFEIPEINYIENYKENTAIIVDLPGNESIIEGIALAKNGFRPIPIYNGTNEQKGSIATVKNSAIQIGLIKGALELKKFNLSKEALPAFLLDSCRMQRYKMNESVFDNSWDIYDQDIPSAQYFLANNINKIIVRGDKLQKDLKKILYKFQKEKIEIFFTNGYEEPKKIHIRKPFLKEKN